VAAIVGVICGCSAAFGQQVFSLSATPTGGTPIVVNGSNLLDLAQNVIDAKSEFASLSGQPFTAGLTWGGVKNAMVFTSNASGSVVTFSLPQTGYTQTFTADNRDDVETQIKDFIKKGGPDVFAAFLHKIDDSTPLGVVSGNPQAVTEVYAMAAFDRYGMSPNFATAGKSNGNSFQVGADLSAGRASTSEGHESYYMADIYSGIRFTNNVAFQLALPIEYRDNDSAATYMAGLQAGLPITIIPDGNSDGLFWQVTPWATVAGGFSPDLAAGGLVDGGGGTSSLNLRTGGFVWTLADQYSRQSGLPIHVQDYHYDTSANQALVSNGLKVTYNFSSAFFVDGGAAYTDVLDSARVKDYLTMTAGLGFHLGAHSGISVNYDGDYGHTYKDYGGDVDLWWSF
jgi:hypothetical protein